MVERLRGAARPLLRTFERWRTRLSRRRVGVALVYHRLDAAPGDRMRDLVPALAAGVFEEHLRRLYAHYRLVPASTLLGEARRRRFGARVPVAITFDDDLRSHVDVALPALRRAGAPATFFLCGASLERPHAFWWEDLQQAVDAGLPLEDLPLPAAAAAEGMRAVARSIEEATPQERARVASALRRIVGERGHDVLDAAGVRALAEAGFEIGFHTRDHEPLPTLAEDELERALRDGRELLAQAAAGPVSVLAYPHGRAGDREASAARGAGYEVAFVGGGEAVLASDDPFLLGRIEPSFESADVLEAQLGRALSRTRPR